MTADARPLVKVIGTGGSISYIGDSRLDYVDYNYVAEAGGSVMLRHNKTWAPMGPIVPAWDIAPPTMKQLRDRVQPLVAGKPRIAPIVADNLRPRSMPLKRRLIQMARHGRRRLSNASRR